MRALRPIPLLLLAACTGLFAPPGAVERYRDAPDELGLLALDVAAGTLDGWAIVLAADDADGTEVTFRPEAGAAPASGVATIARAVPPGRYRAVRVMAVEDGARCGAKDGAGVTRAVYPARLGGEAPAVALAPGQALYLGRIGLRAQLLACEGPTIRVEARSGAPASASRRLGLPLVAAGPLLPPGTQVLTPR
jgi:hypothetical protein